ncbi:alpha/beta hydrolase-fold protein [Parafrigoribacterium mesophilum]|uniref:alpha/beta hydrolase n=1 Tax=Parafrigoribacterium mesophilum TaxID=433646 RepID=UPI0031FE0295
MVSLLDVDILAGPMLYVVYGIAAALVILAASGVFGLLGSRRVWVVRTSAAAVLGAATGLVLSWLIADVWNTFGAPVSAGTRAWGCATLAGIAVAINAFWRTRWWTKVTAAVTVVSVLVAGLLGINADIGQYHSLRAVFSTQIRPIALPPKPAASRAPLPEARPLWQSWKPPANMPASGRLGAVSIPGVVSKFPARQAVLYLPPAALVADAPPLPVVIVLSGQPGQPMNDFQSANLHPMLEAFQRAHNGLAPIVIAPDQLGTPFANPMCVDSRLGNSAEYLTVDVPAWIRSHLHVLPGAASWAIGGFSQGGTCAIQLGAAHPELFGAILDVSGELVPRNGSPQHTIAVGFGGNAAAYQRAKPVNILAAHAPYADMTAIFGVGQTDARYTAWARQVAKAAATAGMTTTFIVAPGTGHDWHTASYVLAAGMRILCAKFGLARS